MTARGPVHVAARPTPAPALTRAPAGLLQRKCACGGTAGLTGECAECRDRRLTLQRRAVHQSAPSEVPAIVHEVLRSPGRPLDPAARAFHGPRFGHDFSRVRIHTDGRAARAARAVGSLAYTVGEQIVFGAGQYNPSSAAGRALLAHELAHVVQGAGGYGLPRGIAPADSPREREADQAAAAVSGGTRARLAAGAPPLVHRKIDPTVRAWLDAIDTVKESAQKYDSSDAIVVNALTMVADNLGLSDPDNLRMFVDKLRNSFSDRPNVVVKVLTWVEDHYPTPVEFPPSRPLPMVVQPRGPYKQYFGTGALSATTTLLVRPFAELIEAILYAFQSAGAFLAGIGEGIGTLSEEKGKEFATRVLGSMVLSLGFTPAFLAGAAVGVLQDAKDMFKGIVDLVTNFRQLLRSVWDLVKTLFTSQGPKLARAIGFEMGKGFADKIMDLLQYNRIRFAYELGLWIGPTLVYIVLSFLGVPELAFARIAERFPQLARFLRATATTATKAVEALRQSPAKPLVRLAEVAGAAVVWTAEMVIKVLNLPADIASSLASKIITHAKQLETFFPRIAELTAPAKRWLFGCRSPCDWEPDAVVKTMNRLDNAAIERQAAAEAAERERQVEAAAKRKKEAEAAKRQKEAEAAAERRRQEEAARREREAEAARREQEQYEAEADRQKRERKWREIQEAERRREAAQAERQPQQPQPARPTGRPTAVGDTERKFVHPYLQKNYPKGEWLYNPILDKGRIIPDRPIPPKGTTRPDHYNAELKIAVEDKNYNIAENRPALIQRIKDQQAGRIANLPPGTKQWLVVDFRGQDLRLYDQHVANLRKDLGGHAIFDEIHVITENGVRVYQ